VIRSFVILSTAIFTALAIAQNNVRLHIITLPDYHPSGSNITPQFHLMDGIRKTSILNLVVENYKYKITGGGWDNGECRKAPFIFLKNVSQ